MALTEPLAVAVARLTRQAIHHPQTRLLALQTGIAASIGLCKYSEKE